MISPSARDIGRDRRRTAAQASLLHYAPFAPRTLHALRKAGRRFRRALRQFEGAARLGTLAA
jgi:hypothetical protein